MNSVLNIENLPPEVLLHVFSFLSPAYLSETVSQVCTHWEDLCKDPSLYRDLTFRGREPDKVSKETVIKILKVAPLLKSLTLVDWNDMNEILRVVSKHNQNIHALVLKKRRGKPVVVCSNVMKKILQNCNELDTLILHKYKVHSKMFYENICNQLPLLKTLHVIDNEKYSLQILEHLVRASSYLELENIHIYDNDCIYEPPNYGTTTALCIGFCNTLRSLRLGDGDWSPESFSALKSCVHLESLSIVFPTPNVCNENILAIGSIHTLRHLELVACCCLAEAIWVRLVSSEGLRNLVSLDLRDSGISDMVAAAIGVHLKNLETLTLDGIGQDLTTDGVKDVFAGCSKILHLKLFKFEPETFEEVILFIPQCLPGLRRLSFFPRADGAVAHLKTHMPELHVGYEDLSRR